MEKAQTIEAREPSHHTIALRCAGCGANLEVEPGDDHLACGYCGTKQEVVRRGGAIRLKKLEDAISRVQQSTDRTAAELAIPRLERELLQADADRQRLLAAPVRVAARKQLANAVIGMLIVSVVAFFSMISLMQHDVTTGFGIHFAWILWLAGLAGSGIGWVALNSLRRGDLAKAKAKRDEQINRESASEVLKILEALAAARAVVGARG